MDTRSVSGIFLSYHLQPGGEPSGDYHVLSLEDVRECDLTNTDWPKYITIHRVRQISLKSSLEPHFPFAAYRDRQLRSVQVEHPMPQELLPPEDLEPQQQIEEFEPELSQEYEKSDGVISDPPWIFEERLHLAHR